MGGTRPSLTACDGPDNQKGFSAAGDGIRKRRIDGVVRDILFAREEADKGAALLRVVLTDGSLQHRVARFERIDHGANGRMAGQLKNNFAVNARQIVQMRGENDANH